MKTGEQLSQQLTDVHLSVLDQIEHVLQQIHALQATTGLLQYTAAHQQYSK